jgi:hypothetical protein
VGDDAEAAKLLWYQALLVVDSTLDTQVFVQGVPVGKTNTRLVVKCGWRYVRLGDAPGAWKSEGASLSIPCQKLARVSLP